ncbi:leucine-rich repeat domain-containing protein [candidate division KSB1 bacterium]
MRIDNSYGILLNCILIVLAVSIFSSCGEEVTVSPLNHFQLPVLNRDYTHFAASTDHVEADGISTCTVSVTPISREHIRMGRGLKVEFFSTYGTFTGDVLYDPATSTYYQTLKPVKDETGMAHVTARIEDQALYETVSVEFYLGIYFSNKNLENVIKENLGKPGEPIYQEDINGLYELMADGVDLSDLTGIGTCSALRKISFINCQINNFGHLSDMTLLKTLNLSKNQIVDLAPLASLTGLDSLNLSENIIRDLSPLSGLTNLEYLCLNSNVVQFISPLRNLSGLKILNLRDNFVSDIYILTYLTNLEYLDLADNSVYYIKALIDNEGLGNGDIIYLFHNPLNNESINSFIPLLQQRGVTVYF